MSNKSKNNISYVAGKLENIKQYLFQNLVLRCSNKPHANLKICKEKYNKISFIISEPEQIIVSTPLLSALLTPHFEYFNKDITHHFDAFFRYLQQFLVRGYSQTISSFLGWVWTLPRHAKSLFS